MVRELKYLSKTRIQCIICKNTTTLILKNCILSRSTINNKKINLC